MTAQFQNRQDAGRLLAGSLAKYAGRDDVIVVAISGGGMLVALEIAKAIGSPIEMLVTQQIRVPIHDPWQEVQAMGALASGGATVLCNEIVEALHLQPCEVEQAVAFAQRESVRKQSDCCGAHSCCDVSGRVVILVDDAIDTADAMRAGIETMRGRNVRFVVVATPVALAGSWRQIAGEADEIVCLMQLETAWPPPFYEGCPPVSDEEVRAILEGHLGRGASEAVGVR